MAALVLVPVVAVGYIAVLGVELGATEENLTADWRSANSATVISLKPDGTFAASGIDACIGDVGIVLDGSGPPTDTTVSAGTGAWHIEPNPAAADQVLIMEFRSPEHFQLRWQVGRVTWQFRPTAAMLTNLNPPVSADGTVGHCLLQA